MKQTFLILIGSFFLCTLCKAQDCKSYTITPNFESGYSFGHAGIVGAGIGVNFSQFSIRVGFDAHLSDKVKDGLVLRSELAHTFNIGESFYAMAGFGHAYLYKSADSKSLNSNQFLIHPEIGYKFEMREQPVAFYVGYLNAGSIHAALLGLRGYF